MYVPVQNCTTSYRRVATPPYRARNAAQGCQRRQSDACTLPAWGVLIARLPVRIRLWRVAGRLDSWRTSWSAGYGFKTTGTLCAGHGLDRVGSRNQNQLIRAAALPLAVASNRTRLGCMVEHEESGIRWWCMAALLGLCSLNLTAAPGVAQAMEIPLSLEEPDGVARISEPLSSGVPLPPGTQISTWSLWDGASEIPVQVTQLPGRSRWILVDCQVNLQPSERKTLILRDQTASATPPNPLQYTEDAISSSITTGPLQVVISKTAFNLFDRVAVDRDGNGIFSQDEQIASTSPTNVSIVDASTGSTFAAAGAPDRVTWEYRGPLRASLRIDGHYSKSSTPFISYTTRITFYAGQTYLKVEQLLRNSYQTNERPVKISSATLEVGSGATAVRATRPGSITYANVGMAGAKFELVPATLWYIDTASNGGMVIPDLSYHGATIVLDFAANLSSSDQTRMQTVVRSPLFARAPARWFSDYGELSTTHFSTLQDEEQANTLWGWSWTASQEPHDPHNPDQVVNWHQYSVHDDLEADDVWQDLMMFIRTGERGYWDRTMAWSRYYKWEYAYRTDGFEYAWNTTYENLDVQYQRPLIPIPLTSTDQGYLSGDVRLGKCDVADWGADHMFGWGLVDYYYLTGDVDALEAAVDLAEIAKRIWVNRVPGEQLNTGTRWGARNLLITCRVWEATQRPDLASLMSHFADLFVLAPDFDVRGIYYTPDPSGTGKAIGALMIAPLSQAMDRLYALQGDTRVRDKMIAVATWARDNALHLTLQYSSSHIVMDPAVPNSGTLWFDRVSPAYTLMWTDTIVRGYRLTGDASYLNRAKWFWEQASKSVDFPARRVVPDDQVGAFLNNQIAYNGLYVDNGTYPFAHLLFYDVTHGTNLDQIPPAAPSDLRAK